MNSEFSVAVHSLVFLNHRGTTLSSEELAKNVCTNPARIRKIMAKLKKAELVATKEGIDGGYHFIRDPSTVTLREVSEALEMRFVSATWQSGDTDKMCIRDRKNTITRDPECLYGLGRFLRPPGQSSASFFKKIAPPKASTS